MLAVNTAFEQILDAYAMKLAGRSEGMCQIHPGGNPSEWSMQGVVEHLVLTYRGTIASLDKYMQRGSPTGRKADWKQLAARLVVVDLQWFPRGNPAPEFVLPGRNGMAPMSGDELCAVLGEALHLLDGQLVRCEQVFGTRAVAPHFRLGPLSAKQWRKFHMVHGRHHLAQLDRITSRLQTSAMESSSEKGEIPADHLRSSEDGEDAGHTKE